MKKKNGFTLIELMMTLLIGGVLLASTYGYYTREAKKTARANEASTLKIIAGGVGNFVSTYQSQLIDITSNGKIIVISPEKLQTYGILPKGEQYKSIVDPYTKNTLYPCATIFYANKQLQGYIYYRTDSTKQYSENDMKNAMLDLNSAIKINGDLGLVDMKNGGLTISGSRLNWSLNKDEVNKYFQQTGEQFLNDPTNLNSCNGSQIAYPTFGYNLGSTLSFQKTLLDPQDSVSQYNHLSINNNTDNNNVNGLSLDSGSAGGQSGAYSNVSNNKMIFQNNPNCVMDPSKLSTMQDYSTNAYGCSSLNDKNGDCSNLDKANIFGCRNKQLSLGVVSGITVDNKTNLSTVMVNGFSKNTTTGVTTGIDNTYLGSLSTYSIQPSAKVGYAATCKKQDVGTMALQNPDSSSELPGTPSAIIEFHKLNQNMMICQKNILCPTTTSQTEIGFCWLPLNSMNINVNFSVSDQVVSFRAPEGYYIKPGSVVYSKNPTEVILQAINRAAPGQQPYQNRNSENRCYHRDNNFVGDTWANGWLNVMNDNSGAIMAYLDIASFYPDTKNLTNIGWSEVKGWKVMTDKNLNKTYNYLNPYTYWTVQGDEANGKYPTPSSNYNYVNQWKSPYYYKLNYPIIAFPYIQLFGTHWDAGKSGMRDMPPPDCDGWKNGNWAGGKKTLSDTYYITSLTISNDTSDIPVDTAIIPTPPPIPIPKPQVKAISFNGYYVCGGVPDANNPLLRHPSPQEPRISCWIWNSNLDYQNSLEVQIGGEYRFPYKAVEVGNGDMLLVMTEKSFLVTDNPSDTEANAYNVGLTQFRYRYHLYDDNSCMTTAGHKCWLWDDAAHTIPHYTLRTVAP